MRYYEDFEPGEKIDLGSRTISADEVIEFAKEFDPAPFHLSEADGRKSMLGGLAASGWHCCSLGMRMICDTVIKGTASQGAPGVDECKWLSPVYAGSTIRGTATVLGKRVSKSLPAIGFVKFEYAYFTDGGKPAFIISSSAMISRRASGASK